MERRVYARCAVSGETVPTQAFVTERRFAHLRLGLTMFCASCRGHHAYGAADLTVAPTLAAYNIHNKQPEDHTA